MSSFGFTAAFWATLFAIGWYLSTTAPNALSFYFLPALTYMVVANPATYQTTRALGSWVATPEGTAKMGGLVLHAIVFIVVVRLLMNVFPPRRSGYRTGGMINQGSTGSMIQQASNGAMVGSVYDVSPIRSRGKDLE